MAKITKSHLLTENADLKNKVTELEKENINLKLLVIKLEGDLKYFKQIEATYIEAQKVFNDVCKTFGSLIPQEQKQK